MYRPKTLKEVADFINDGIGHSLAVKEFIDELRCQIAAGNDINLMIMDEPAMTEHPVHDVFLAGLAELVAAHISSPTPAWTEDKSRFLDEPVYIGGKHSRAMMIEETPVAMSRRGFFCGDMDLQKSLDRSW